MLFWYSDPLIKNKKNPENYKRKFIDGYLPGGKKKIETFYKEFDDFEIENMLNICGFEIDRSYSDLISEFTQNSLAYIAYPKKEPLISKSIDFKN